MEKQDYTPEFRQQVIEAYEDLLGQEGAANQVAERFGIKPATLFYFVAQKDKAAGIVRPKGQKRSQAPAPAKREATPHEKAWKTRRAQVAANGDQKGGQNKPLDRQFVESQEFRQAADRISELESLVRELKGLLADCCIENLRMRQKLGGLHV